MKASFALILLSGSIILNVVLIGRLQSVNQRPVAPVAVPGPVPTPVAATPFRWSRLESSDYPTYIANLRAIGCPEQTVREIIAADVDDSYAPRREPLLRKIAAGGVMVEVSQSQDALAQLRAEEAAVIRKLFGIPDPVEPSATAQAASPQRRPADEDVDPPSMPLVFQPVDTNRVNFTPEELDSIERVRQTFLKDLGTNQDVNSPEYFRRWQKAQQYADALLLGLLGQEEQYKYIMAVQSQSAPGN